MSHSKDKMKEFGLSEGWIITYNEQRTIDIEEGTVRVIPAWLWLLEY